MLDPIFIKWLQKLFRDRSLSFLGRNTYQIFFSLFRMENNDPIILFLSFVLGKRECL